MASLRRGARVAAAALALLLAGAAAAGTLGPLVTEQPLAWHGGVIRPGDLEAQVRRVAGRYPDNEQTLYLGDQHPVGVRWAFVGDGDDRRVLYVEFMRGRVTRAWTEPIDESLRLGAPPPAPR